MHHLLRPRQDSHDIDTHHRGGRKPEGRERRIPPANLWVSVKDPEKAPLVRGSLELRPGVGDGDEPTF